jgi:mannose-6-phosphate isomerase-like protein (cupin superfamily)
MTMTPARAYVLAPTEGRALWHLGSLLQFKAVGEDTNDQFWLLEGTANQGSGPPLHVHAHEDEFFYILDGEVRVTIGEENTVVGPGGVAYGPRNVPHTFKVESTVARWLSFAMPAGFERFFFETGQPAQSLTIPPPPTVPPDLEQISSTLERYGGKFL